MTISASEIAKTCHKIEVTGKLECFCIERTFMSSVIQMEYIKQRQRLVKEICITHVLYYAF